MRLIDWVEKTSFYSAPSLWGGVRWGVKVID